MIYSPELGLSCLSFPLAAMSAAAKSRAEQSRSDSSMYLYIHKRNVSCTLTGGWGATLADSKHRDSYLLAFAVVGALLSRNVSAESSLVPNRPNFSFLPWPYSHLPRSIIMTLFNPRCRSSGQHSPAPCSGILLQRLQPPTQQSHEVA